MKSNTHDIQEMYLYFLSAMHEPLTACLSFITSYQPALVLSVLVLEFWDRVFAQYQGRMGPTFGNIRTLRGVSHTPKPP
jgi:hypothetical protein